MRFSNKAMCHWSLLTEGLLDCSLGTRGLGGRGCGSGEGQGNTTSLSEKAEGWAGEGELAPGLLQGGHRLVTGEPILIPRPWSCLNSQGQT